MEKTETQNRVPITAKVPPIVRLAVEQIAEEEDRSTSNLIERVLKNTPEIAKKISELEQEAAAAA